MPSATWLLRHIEGDPADDIYDEDEEWAPSAAPIRVRWTFEAMKNFVMTDFAELS